MSNKLISQLPEVTSVEETDVIPTVQNGVTSKIKSTVFINTIKSVFSSIDYGLDLPYQSPNGQIPTQSDVLTKISFGASKTENNIELSTDGFIKFTEIGTYLVKATLSVAREGNAGQGGESAVGLVAEQDGTNNWGTQMIVLPNYKSTHPYVWDIIVQVTEIDGGQNTLRFYQFRDSGLSHGAGANGGGLYSTPITNQNIEKPWVAGLQISKLE